MRSVRDHRDTHVMNNDDVLREMVEELVSGHELQHHPRKRPIVRDREIVAWELEISDEDALYFIEHLARRPNLPTSVIGPTA